MRLSFADHIRRVFIKLFLIIDSGVFDEVEFFWWQTFGVSTNEHLIHVYCIQYIRIRI